MDTKRLRNATTLWGRCMSGDSISLVDEIAVGNSLGEGVQWRQADQSVWWTDIHGCKLYQLRWPSRELIQYGTPEPLTAFAFTAEEGKLLASFAGGFAWFYPADGHIEYQHRIATDGGVRLNDGRLDRQGRFWTASMSTLAEPDASGSLYCLDGEAQLSVHEIGLQIGNGCAWSPDSRTFYLADSPRRRIDAYDFDAAAGRLSGRRRFVETPMGAYPDGATVDSDGMLWSAHWGAGQVLRYRSDGSIDCSVAVPAKQSSCVCFGGAELNLLFVTSAREGLDDEALAADPRAGNLFVYETPFRGLTEGVYNGR